MFQIKTPEEAKQRSLLKFIKRLLYIYKIRFAKSIIQLKPLLHQQFLKFR